MTETPMPTQNTIDACSNLIRAYLEDSDAFQDDLNDLAHNDPNSPIPDMLDNEDPTPEQENAAIEFEDAVMGMGFLNFAMDFSPEIREFVDNVHEMLEVYNARDMLNGYLNEPIRQLNSLFRKMGKSDIELAPDDDLTTD